MRLVSSLFALLLAIKRSSKTMARWFRSEDMAYVSIIVNEDAAHTCISDLGKLGMIQFTDLNPELTAFQRRYVAYIKRIDELERKLAFFGEEVRAGCVGVMERAATFTAVGRFACYGTSM